MNSQINAEKYNVFKGLAILMVVCTHVLFKFHGSDKPALVEAFNYIIGFAVPLFMVLGGFFIKPKLLYNVNLDASGRMLAHLFRRVIVPYYIFAILLLLTEYATGGKPSLLPLFFVDVREHGLYYLILYTYAYTLAVLLSLLVNFVFSARKEMMLIICLPLISLVFFPLSNILVEKFPGSTVAETLPYVAFFMFGAPLRHMYDKIAMLDNQWKALIAASLLSFLYTIALYLARKTFGFFPIISINRPTLFLLIYSLLIFLIAIILLDRMNIFCTLGRKLSFIEFGEKSLFIYLVHPYFVYFLPYIFHLLFSSMINNNMFIFPLILTSYCLAFISMKIFDLLPLRARKLFIR